VTDFVHQTEKGRHLVSLAALCVQIRDATKLSTWGEAASWEPLTVVLELPEARTHAAAEEVKAAVNELSEARSMSEEGVLNALKNGRSIKKSEGQWDHRSIRRSFVHTYAPAPAGHTPHACPPNAGHTAKAPASLTAGPTAKAPASRPPPFRI
jgi:hypothetical protein